MEEQKQQRLGDRLEQMDQEIKAWGKLTRKALLFRLNSLGLQDRVKLVGQLKLRKSLRSKARKKNGEIERIAFSLAKHGIFLEHGVGKGRPVGSAKAQKFAKPWLKPVLDPAIENLANLLEQEFADIAADQIRLLIPGIIDVKTNP